MGSPSDNGIHDDTLVTTDKETFKVEQRKAGSPPSSYTKTEKQKNNLVSLAGYVIFGLFTAAISGVGVNYFNSKISDTSNTATFRAETSGEIQNLKEKIVTLTNKNQELKKEQKIPEVKIGYIGSMGNIKSIKKKTSFGADYISGKHICEIHTGFYGWKELGTMPYLGSFFEIENAATGYKTWVMVVGSYTLKNEHPEVAMLVSQYVTNLLVPEKKSIKISGRIRPMTKLEVQKNLESVSLLKSYGLTLQDVFDY